MNAIFPWSNKKLGKRVNSISRRLPRRTSTIAKMQIFKMHEKIYLENMEVYFILYASAAVSPMNTNIIYICSWKPLTLAPNQRFKT